MKILRRLLFFIITVSICGNLHAQSQKALAELMRQRDEYYFSVNVQDPSEIQAINTICSVDATNGSTVVCYANPTQYNNLLAAGYQPHLLTPPSLREEVEMYDPQRDSYDWNAYLTYQQYVDMMEGFPTMAVSGRTCTLLDLGTLSTSNHRRILGVRLNNGQPDGKPKFLYTSTMHGDEVTGMILMLRLIDEFCTSTDSRIVNLLNNLDIFIFPCTNPDGTYYGGNNTVNGARRYNGNNIDLNRHFPDFDDGPHPDGASYYQDEAQWMMDLAQQYLFTMGANYHGGAEVVNYPWDTYQPVHPDDAWWRLVCTEYVTNARAVSSSYMTDTYSSGITNGYAWYTINGSRQDYMNYYGQCRELTLECSSSKTPSASQLPNFWNYNHNSMLTYMEQCLKGVHGVVRDANTQQPIEGVTVKVQNHDALGSWVTSHAVGDFHRPIKGGNYTFKFTKEGYCSETVDVSITDGARVDLEVYLSPSGSCAVECYENTMPTAEGNYVMGYRNGNTLTMPTNSSGSSTSSTVNITPNEEDGFAVEEGEIESPFVLTSTGTSGQYYISYNGYYLTRSTSGWGSGNKAITWSTSQSNNNRWTISDTGISQTSSSSWGGSTTYYLFYSGGSFYTGTSNNNNITFYQEGDCPGASHTISVTANPSDGGTVTGGGSYQDGESCTVSATANANYTFENWTENNNVVSTNANYTFTVYNSRNLVAHFTAIPLPTYNVSVTANPANGGSVTGGGTYTEGETCTITATPNTNYTFNNWTENGEVISSDANYTFTVNANQNLVANFTYIPPTYTVSVSANPTNGGTVAGGGTYTEGESCTITATPNTNYTFNNWAENGEVISSNASYTFTVNANHNLVANFTYIPPTYTISVSANPTNGGTVAGGGNYTEGESCTVTATPNTNYTFNNWTENGEVISSDASYTFIVNENHNLVANFTYIPPTYTVSVSANPNNGGTVAGGGTYTEGVSCTVTATANNGYTFNNWTENGEVISSDASYTFIVNENHNLVANFTVNTYTVSVAANPSNGGSVTGGGSFTYGQSCTITAIANDGFTFINWTENGSYVSSDANYSFTVNSNRNFVAHFTENPLPTYTITVVANPANAGTVVGNGTYQEGQSCTVTAMPVVGYSFINWTENDVEVSTNSSYTFTVTGNRNLVANFDANTYTIDVVASPAEGGSVAGGGTFHYGETITLTATPNAHYEFVRWSDGNTDNPHTVIVTEDATYTAVFREIAPLLYSITAEVNPEEGGEVFGDGVYPEGANIILTAIVYTDYTFKNWTENGVVVSYDESYAFTVTGNRHLVANLIHIDGIEEQNDIMFALYPNPVSNKLTIEASEAINQIEIFNIVGTTVFSQKNCGDKVEIHTADLPAGTYLIRMTTPSATEVRRFVKK